MSIEAVNWALNVPLGGNLKVILLGMANHAHPDGTEAYPSLDTLARYASCDRSTARRNVRKLVEEGWLIPDGEGPKKTVKYRLSMVGGGVLLRVASAPEGGGIAVPPEPSKEPSYDSLRSSLQRAREHAGTLNPKGQAVLGKLIAVAEAKRCQISDPQKLVEISREYRNRDLEAEAVEFHLWYCEGNGENIPVRSLAGRWRKWLARAPTAETRARAVKRPGRKDEERRERARRDMEAVQRLMQRRAA